VAQRGKLPGSQTTRLKRNILQLTLPSHMQASAEDSSAEAEVFMTSVIYLVYDDGRHLNFCSEECHVRH
jgi:hypothetical protein